MAPDSPADRPPLFTDQDVDLLDHALVDADGRHGAIGPGHVGCTLACSRCIARKALEALAEAGRLAPVSSEHREQWGVRLVWDDGPRCDEPMTFDRSWGNRDYFSCDGCHRSRVIFRG